MNYFEKAIEKELDRDFVSAIDFYEKSISNKEIVLDSYINLAFIYWISAAEFATREFYKIPVEIAHKGDKRHKVVLDAALSFWALNTELHFWKGYFPHRLIFSDFSEEDVLKIIRKYGDTSLVPYFFLYLFNKEKYKPQRDKLLESCQKLPTAKNVHIISLIEKEW